jgi:hypothetical protein
MKLDGIVRAHEFMHTERPEVLWEADTQDEVFIRLLGEMIAFALQRSSDVSTLTLNVANVVIHPEAARPGLVLGDYLAVTVRGPGAGTPELVWVPNAPLTFGPFGDLDHAALKSQAVWVYSRNLGDMGSITAFFRRLVAPSESGGAPPPDPSE